MLSILKMRTDSKKLKKNLSRLINLRKLSICMNIKRIGILLSQWLGNLLLRKSMRSSLTKPNSTWRGTMTIPKLNRHSSMLKNPIKLSACIKKLNCMVKLLE
jgi:hypothetical protein